MAQPNLLTFLDALEYAQSYLGGAGAGKGTMEVRQAVLSAYSELVMERTWNYFRRWTRITLEAPQSSSSSVATFDFTGGASERLLTLSSGTFPTNTIYYHLKLGDSTTRIHKFATRESSTTATLDAELNPGADVAATTYTMFRSVYQLPSDFLQLDRPYNQDAWWYQHYVSLSDMVALEKYQGGSGPSYAFTIIGDPDNLGSMSIQFYTYPDAVKSMDFAYRSFGRPLVFDGIHANDRTGTVSLTSGSAVVTGSGTTFTSDMVGSVFRYSHNTQVPTGNAGLNRYAGQGVVKTFTSTTSITLHANASETVSGRAFVISDPVDLEQSMINAYLKRLQYELASMRNMKNKESMYTEYREAVKTAAVIDGRRHNIPRRPFEGHAWRNRLGQYGVVGSDVNT